MLKLKYLFDNRDLALMLLGYWKYDEETLEIMDRFRISSNAVYPFYRNGELHFLRFAPEQEKEEMCVRGELDFIEAVRSEFPGAVKIAAAKSGETLVRAHTPWGDYLAVVFRGVPGRQLTECMEIASLYYKWGRLLAELHESSARLGEHKFNRRNYENLLDQWCRNPVVREEAERLKAYFSELEKTVYNYGMIHYDFEMDNVFYDEASDRFYVIDFDDCMYHWYEMDVVAAIASIMEEIPEDGRKAAKEEFLKGYRKIRKMEDGFQERWEMFQRFQLMYSYVRLSEAIRDKWDNEPEWLQNLRGRLESYLKQLKNEFIDR